MLSKKYYKTIVMVDSWLANAGEVIAQTGYDDINIFGYCFIVSRNPLTLCDCE